MADSPDGQTGRGSRRGGRSAGRVSDRNPPGGIDRLSRLRGVTAEGRTRAAIKSGLTTYAVFGVGYALVAAGIGLFGSGPVGDLVTGDTVVITLAVSFSPLLAVVLGHRYADILTDLPTTDVAATSAVANAGGVLVVAIVGVVLALGSGAPGSDVTAEVVESIAAVAVGAVGAAFVGAGTVVAVRRFAE